MFLRRSLPLFLAAASMPMFCGCPTGSGDGAADAPADASADADGGGHHGHSHDDPGPAGGHILEIGDEEYHVEWVHDEDDDSVITFIVRDEMAKEEFPIAADRMVLEFTVEDASGQESKREVDVPAVGQSADNPKTAKFELTDRVAIGNILGGSEDVTTVLKVTIDGVAYEKQIEHHAGHGHSHSH